MATQNTPTTMTTLIDLLSDNYAPIQTNILNHLGSHPIAKLARTCKVLDLRPLLSLQAKSGGIFCGEFVSYFLTCQRWDPLTFIINVEDFGYKMLNDYIEQDGFVVTHSHISMTTFAKSGPGGDRFIRVINSENKSFNEDSAVRVFLSYTGDTMELNLMMWNKVYSLFPKATFGNKTFCVTSTPSIILDYKVQKLLVAGFQSKDVDDLGADKDYWTQTRRIGDRHTWILELDTTGVESPVNNSFYIECTIFGLGKTFWEITDPAWMTPGWPAIDSGYWLNHPNTTHFRMRTMEVIESPVLRHKYTILADGDIDAEALRTRLTALTLKEMKKMPQSSRPAHYAQILAGKIKAADSKVLFTTPDTWTYWDDVLSMYLMNGFSLAKSEWSGATCR